MIADDFGKVTENDLGIIATQRARAVNTILLRRNDRSSPHI
jgi:hypothetical protein